MKNEIMNLARIKRIPLLNVEDSPELRFYCPVCPIEKSFKFKLYFNTVKRKGICQVCKTRFSLKLLSKLTGLGPIHEVKSIANTSKLLKGLQSVSKLIIAKKLNVTLPTGSPIGPKSTKPYQYLGSRNVTPQIFKIFNLFYCSDDFDLFYGRIIIPIYSQKKVLVSFIGRSVAAYLRPKYLFKKNAKVFDYLFREDFITNQEIAVIFEGTFSVMRTYLYFKSAFEGRVISLASFSKHCSVTQELTLKESGIRRFIIFYDGDATDEAVKLSARINKWGISNYISLPVEKQPDDYPVSKLSEMVQVAIDKLPESRLDATCTKLLTM